MDEVPQPVPVEEEDVPGKIASAFELGVFEVLFVAVILLAIFGLLNYFNILPVSQKLPFLSFLPHKVWLIPKNPTPTLTTNSALLQKAKTDLPILVKESLNQTFMPSSFNIQPLKNTSGQILDPNRITSGWQVNNYSIFASVRYNGADSELEDKEILITNPASINSLNTTSSAQLVSVFFKIKTGGNWKCDNIELKDKDNKNAVLCENFWVDNGSIKRGIDVMSSMPNTTGSSISMCELHPISPLYNMKSCSSYKASTGL